MSNVVSISVYKDRKNNVASPKTERQAEVMRGFIKWKINNHRRMKDAGEARQKKRREKRRKVSLSMRLRGPRNRTEFFARSRDPKMTRS